MVALRLEGLDVLAARSMIQSIQRIDGGVAAVVLCTKPVCPFASCCALVIRACGWRREGKPQREDSGKISWVTG